MSERLVPVAWTRTKLVYDAVVIAAVCLFLFGFEHMARVAGAASTPTDEGSLAIRIFGACAFLLVTCALAVGPLARLDPRFLPLLYNRRHLGVLTFAVAAAHAYASFDWYFAFSPTPSWVAALAADAAYRNPANFPYVPFGLLALLLLAVLAATSHDFWLKFLGPGLWKTLHLAIYPAYVLIVAHVALGALQGAQGPGLPALVGGSAAGLVVLHLAAALKDRRTTFVPATAPDGWLDIGLAADIPASRGKVVHVPRHEAVAIFNDDGVYSALSNRCAHQGGPLGEGRVVDGCAVCPWHGYEYRLETGRAPAPFTERVRTYSVRLVDGRLYLDPTPSSEIDASDVAGAQS